MLLINCGMRLNNSLINKMSSEYVFVLSNGDEVPVVITTRRGIRNITLRPKVRGAREIHISKPWLTPTSAALRFLEQKRNWCERIFAAAPEKEQVWSGMEIEILGRDTKIIHNPNQRANSYIINVDGSATIVVGGGADMFARRVRDVIKAQFLIAVKEIIKTAPHDVRPRRIALRDTTSRWGSCSTTGTISFSWRLAFAPCDVMRYVVMHELAHCRHMDHSPEFWATVSEFYGFGVERAKRWLTKYGATLHQYF